MAIVEVLGLLRTYELVKGCCFEMTANVLNRYRCYVHGKFRTTLLMAVDFPYRDFPKKGFLLKLFANDQQLFACSCVQLGRPRR